MDIPTWARTMWRFKWVSLGGFVLACLLAVFATARVSLAGGVPKLSYRTPLIYTTETKVLITQAGFPLGRTTPFADPNRFVMLASVYATLANSDQIQLRLVNPKKQEALTASPEYNPQTQTALPIVDLMSLAPSRQRATAMALEAAAMLKGYVEQQQKAAGIPASKRVLLQTLQRPYRVTIAKGRKKTVPIVVFMTVMLATIGLVLALENIRPRVRLTEVGEFSPPRSDDSEAAPASRADREQSIRVSRRQ